MLVINYNYLLFRKKEVWFYRGEPLEEGAYNIYCYAFEPFGLPYDRVLNEYTSCIDLSQSEKQLWQGLHRTTRYHVRKCQHPGLVYQYTLKPSVSECQELIGTFANFARGKGIRTNPQRILALRRTGNLALTRVIQDAKVLYTHVYLFDSKRVTLLHTFNNVDPVPRNNANKFLHWNDIVMFKSIGFLTYDLGGINPEKVPGISRFKLSFGGTLEPVKSYTRINPAFRWVDKLIRILKKNIAGRYPSINSR